MRLQPPFVELSFALGIMCFNRKLIALIDRLILVLHYMNDFLYLIFLFLLVLS